MGMPRAVIRVLAYATVTVVSIGSLYMLAFTPSADGVWDASSWADRRTAKSAYNFNSETNPNGVVWDTPRGDQVADRSPSSRWNLFGPKSPPKTPPVRGENSTPRPLPRVNTTQIRNNFGKSRIVVAGSEPETFEEGPLPTLEEAFAHLEPMLRAVKERHTQIPREHQLWQPIFPPFLTDDLQERFWHLREEWDESTKSWKHSGNRRFLLVTVCRQVAGESWERARTGRTTFDPHH